jgi:hypothetical protein
MLRRGLQSFKTQELSNAVWAHATTGLGFSDLFVSVEEEALDRGLAAFSPQDLANMVWAFGKVSDSLRHACVRAIDRMKHGSPDLVCLNHLWVRCSSREGVGAQGRESGVGGLSDVSFSSREEDNQALVPSLVSHRVPCLHKEAWDTRAGTLACISGMPCACKCTEIDTECGRRRAQADHVAALLFEHMKSEFDTIRDQCGSLELFKAQELSNLLWACAKTQHTAKTLFERAEADVREVLACIQTAQDRDGDAGAGADGLLSTLPGGAGEHAIVPVEVSDEMWRYARVGQCADEMFRILEDEILKRDFETFSTQHFANIAWAYVFLKFSRFHQLSSSGNRLLAAVLRESEGRLNDFTLEELRQLGQVCTLPSSSTTRPPSLLSPWLVSSAFVPPSPPPLSATIRGGESLASSSDMLACFAQARGRQAIDRRFFARFLSVVSLSFALVLVASCLLFRSLWVAALFSSSCVRSFSRRASAEIARWDLQRKCANASIASISPCMVRDDGNRKRREALCA